MLVKNLLNEEPIAWIQKKSLQKRPKLLFTCQVRSNTSNKELIKLYWDIGKDIVEKQGQEGWGSKVLERIAKDLQNEFPGIEGFSRRNLFIMRAFYQAYGKVQQAVAQLDNLPIFSIRTVRREGRKRPYPITAQEINFA